jgi:NAD(P)-dependent dehydrogenase (short-subunit alcohol dehydrogenase family)
MPRLTGRTALVTGAARGVGEAIARAFAAEGAAVWCTDIRDDLGAAVAASISGGVYRRLDVRLDADWTRIIDELLAATGRLDILVNNAGITGLEDDPAGADPEHESLDRWRALMATNLDGVFLGCKHAIRAMRPAGAGSIINIGSRSGVVGVPGACAYAASKAAVRNHTKSVALHCARAGLAIRCNVIQPAAILTPMWEPLLGDGPDRAERMAAFVADCPLRRFGKPEEVAALAVHLAADESAYTTGAECTIDGGILAG